MNVQITREALLNFCAAQADWAELVMQSRWVMEGDRGTKRLYKLFKSLAFAKSIHELLDSDGNVKTSWEDMVVLATTRGLPISFHLLWGPFLAPPRSPSITVLWKMCYVYKVTGLWWMKRRL